MANHGQGLEEEIAIDFRVLFIFIRHWAVVIVGLGLTAFGLTWLYGVNLEAIPPTYTSQSVLILEQTRDTSRYVALGLTLGDALSVAGSDGVVKLSVTSGSPALAAAHVERLSERLERMADGVRVAQSERLMRNYDIYMQNLNELTGEISGGPEFFIDYFNRNQVLGEILSREPPVTITNQATSTVREHPALMALMIAVIAAISVAALLWLVSASKFDLEVQA